VDVIALVLVAMPDTTLIPTVCLSAPAAVICCPVRLCVLMGVLQALTVSLQGELLPSAASQATRQRLLQLVRCIIESEAASSSIAPNTSSSSSSSSSHGRLTPAADNPLQDALAGVGWEHAARAPLVVAALRVLSDLQGSEYQCEVVALFPCLCRLMSSSHHPIRVALSKVLSSRDFVSLLPAAQGAAAGPAAAAAAAAAGGVAVAGQQQWQQLVL